MGGVGAESADERGSAADGGEAGVGEPDEVIDAEAEVEAALPARDVDLGVHLGGLVDDYLERAVQQGQGGDAAGLQAGEFFGLVVGGEFDLFLAERFGKRFEVEFVGAGDKGKDGLAAGGTGGDDGLVDQLGGDAEVLGNIKGAELVRGQFAGGVRHPMGVQKAGDVI